MVQAIEMTTPVPASSLPQAGNFYSTQHFPGSAEPWPPLPGNIWGLDAWPLGDNFYLLNDTNVDYDALAALAAAAQPKTATTSTMMTMTSLSTAYAYGNPVYLTNLTATLAADGSTTTSFNVRGGTNFVPYDIEMTTNLSTHSWDWIGIGYTSNNYTFYQQPMTLPFTGWPNHPKP